VLKSLLTPGSTHKVTEFFQRVVHGLLSSCLLNIDEMRGREGSISTNKIKNNFLAAVLILTVIPPSVKVGQGVISRCCFLIAEKLSDSNEVSHIRVIGYLDNSLIETDGVDGSSLRKDFNHGVCLW